MQWKLCQRKNEFHTQTLNYLQMDLVYAHLRNYAPTI